MENEVTPAPEGDATGDAELDAIQQEMSQPDPAIEALKQTDPDTAHRLELERLRKQNERLLSRQRSQALAGYKDQLSTDFPFASPDLINGQTRGEMRKSAERAHAATLNALKALGLDPAALLAQRVAGQQPPAGATPPAAAPAAPDTKTDPKAWGAPPAAATEVVANEGGPDWDDFKRKAARGELTPEEARQMVGARGPRVVVRPNLAGSLAERYGTKQERSA